MRQGPKEESGKDILGRVQMWAHVDGGMCRVNVKQERGDTIRCLSNYLHIVRIICTFSSALSATILAAQRVQ